MSTEFALVPVELLVFQATPFCNIDCAYCYLPDRNSKARIELDTVRACCDGLVQANLVGARPTVLWHAGEPLVMPTAFYQDAFASIEDRFQRQVEHRIQTNATLLTTDWARFLARAGVAVGVSLDGPAWLHDAMRKTRRGRGTHSEVMVGVDRLRQYGVQPSIICVLTAAALRRVEDVFAFFEQHGFLTIAFNIDETGGPYGSSSHTRSAEMVDFKRFLVEYDTLIRRHGSRQIVRELKRGIDVVFAPRVGPGAECLPLHNLTVGQDGQFSTLSPELHGLIHPVWGSFVLGNVHQVDAFRLLDRHPRLRGMMKDIDSGIDSCRRGCAFFASCGGGTIANKFAEHRTFAATETVACRFKRQAVAAAAAEIICRLASSD